MTREEAIDIIKSECYIFNPLNFDRSTMVNTALDMAIKALEFDLDKHDEEVIKNTVETLWGEPCEDCVSREWLKNAIHNFYKGLIHTSTEEDIQAYIDVAPSVKPKPKIGRWIEVTNGRGGHECDLCHEYAPSYQSGDEHLSQYCPNCGAKMTESEDKE